jgi:hypothetical protein
MTSQTPPERNRLSELDEPWYGWGSPVGLGFIVLSLALSVAAILAAVSLLV